MTRLIILLIRFYQKTFSPGHSDFYPGSFRRCRFYPSCSEYAVAAVRQYGPCKGSVFSLFRILSCNPLSRGGYDPLR
ncbi:MAG: membrane protein insertion efficiency factor YidD [bacterium]|nr:membrane protein insertion efficiency factor YidD [bacterium]